MGNSENSAPALSWLVGAALIGGSGQAAMSLSILWASVELDGPDFELCLCYVGLCLCDVGLAVYWTLSFPKLEVGLIIQL